MHTFTHPSHFSQSVPKYSGVVSCRYRDRRKEKGIVEVIKAKSQILTRSEREKKREYWKMKQRQSRLKRSGQKSRRVREKDRSYRTEMRQKTNRDNSSIGVKSRVKSRASSVQFPAHQLKKLHFLEKSSTAVKQFMNENPIIKKKMLKKLVFLKEHRLNRQLSTFLGVRESSVSKQNACEEVRKQRKDCTSEENTEVIRNFFQRTDH